MSHESGHPPLVRGGTPEAPPVGPRARIEDPSLTPGPWDRAANVNRLLYVLYAVCVALAGADLFVHRHTEHPWEHVLAFYPLYGFVGIVMLVVLAKILRAAVMRPEDYYDVQ